MRFWAAPVGNWVLGSLRGRELLRSWREHVLWIMFGENAQNTHACQKGKKKKHGASSKAYLMLFFKIV